MNLKRREALVSEIELKATRSSGPGGQHVNKVSTKVELRFNVVQSVCLNANQKIIIQLKLANKINSEGILVLNDQSSRSQLKNKEMVVDRFIQLIDFALKPQKKRVATKPTKQSKRKRLDDKKRLSAKKQMRKKLGEIN